MLGIPPNRNFKPAIFFPFPFFFPSLEPLIFFRTPGPGKTEDSFGTIQTAIPQTTPSPASEFTGKMGEHRGPRGAGWWPALSIGHVLRGKRLQVKRQDRKASALACRRGSAAHGAQGYECQMGTWGLQSRQKRGGHRRQECGAEPPVWEGCCELRSGSAARPEPLVQHLPGHQELMTAQAEQQPSQGGTRC